MPTFSFDSLDSPSAFNLHRLFKEKGWTEEQSGGDFSEQLLDFNTEATQVLEYKHRLAVLVNKHCPFIAPDTWLVDEGNYHDVFKLVKATRPEQYWILKPALLNNGDGITLFETIEEMLEHFQKGRRYSGPHVLQKYISEPHLLNGHKYSLRMFVVLTNYCGAYLYRDGYFNICRERFDLTKFREKSRHLTNEHLSSSGVPNNYQTPTSRCEPFEPVYKDIFSCLSILFKAYQIEYPAQVGAKLSPKLALLGADFMMDSALNLSLLELNHGPCFPKAESHPLQMSLYQPFWQAFYDNFALPIVSNELSQKPSEKYFATLLGPTFM